MAYKGKGKDESKPDLTDKDNPWGSKYNESMCLEIIDMFSKGKSRAQFCAHHSIANDTFEKWRRKHPLFERAYSVAHEKARAFYDEMRQEHLKIEYDPDEKIVYGINHALFNRMYNARFNVPEKRTVSVKALGKAKDESAMLKALMKAVSDGELTPDEAQKLASLIDVSLKVKQVQELEERLSILEKAQDSGFNDDEFEEVPDD